MRIKPEPQGIFWVKDGKETIIHTGTENTGNLDSLIGDLMYRRLIDQIGEDGMWKSGNPHEPEKYCARPDEYFVKHDLFPPASGVRELTRSGKPNGATHRSAGMLPSVGRGSTAVVSGATYSLRLSIRSVRSAGPPSFGR